MPILFELNSDIGSARSMRERSEDSSLHSTIVDDESARITKLVKEEVTTAYDFNMLTRAINDVLLLNHQSTHRESTDA